MKKLTNHQKVLRILIGNHKEWYFTYDFVGEQFGTFMSHRGPARVSELSKQYPCMIDTDKEGRTFKYRFRFNQTLNFLPMLPKNLKDFVIYELKKNEREYKVLSREPVIKEGIMCGYQNVVKTL